MKHLPVLDGVRGLAILSVLSPSELSSAIALQDKSMVGRANGVGPKLATRIVTELRGKEVVQGWEAQVRAGDLAAVVLDLLVRHYDPMYSASIQRNFKRHAEALPITLIDRSPASLQAAAKALLAAG